MAAALARPKLGERFAEIRRKKNLSLQQVANLTGISRSTLYKVERKGVSLTYDKLVQLSEGLAVDISELFLAPRTVEDKHPVTARRVLTNLKEGEVLGREELFPHNYLCNELSHKVLVPTLVTLKARKIEGFGPLLRHPGEEFTIVMEGEIQLYTEYYEPAALVRGDVVYIDSSMAHAYINRGEGPASILTVCSSHELDMNQTTRATLRKGAPKVKKLKISASLKTVRIKKVMSEATND